MKILCVGEALIDMICTDKGKSLQEGENFLKKAGGAPTNVAAAIAALGGEVELAAKVGADPFGKHLTEVMRSFGVGTGHMIQDPGWFTTFAFVSLMENGERDFYFNRGADGQLSVEETSGIKLDSFSIVHFGSATAFLPGPLQDAYVKLLSDAGKQGLFIAFDPNYRHLLYKECIPAFIKQSWHFLDHCDFFKLSDEEAMLLTQTDNLNAAAAVLQERTRAVFCITLGGEGTLLGCGKETFRVPSISVKVTDTTGAGDAFVGAVLFQLRNVNPSELRTLNAERWYDIVAKANKAGARTCEFLGAMEAFKHLSKDILD